MSDTYRVPGQLRSDALALAREAESPDEQWAWILEALIVHQDDGHGLAEALVTGAHFVST